MSDYIDKIAKTLKGARESKGLSQRALAERADLPQSHISKIENGGVDLRLSSLVELARALDLEVTLIPRKTVPAVQAIVRNITGTRRLRVSGSGHLVDASQSASKYFTRLQETLDKAAIEQPQIKQIAQIQRRVRELQQLKPPVEPDALRELDKFMKTVNANQAQIIDFQKALDRLGKIRNKFAHQSHKVAPPKPAYSLEEEDHG